MYEVLLRPQEISSVSVPPIDTAISKLRKAEVVGEERRLRQIELARARNKRKRDEAAGIGLLEDNEVLDSDGPPQPKRRKEAASNDVDSPTVMEEGELKDAVPQNESKTSATHNGHQAPSRLASAQITRTLQVAHPCAEVRGHTSYLTFAVLLPYDHITNTAQGLRSNPGIVALAPEASAGDTTITTEGHTDYGAYDDYFRSIPDDVSRAYRDTRLGLTSLKMGCLGTTKIHTTRSCVRFIAPTMMI